MNTFGIKVRKERVGLSNLYLMKVLKSILASNQWIQYINNLFLNISQCKNPNLIFSTWEKNLIRENLCSFLYVLYGKDSILRIHELSLFYLNIFDSLMTIILYAHNFFSLSYYRLIRDALTMNSFESLSLCLSGLPLEWPIVLLRLIKSFLLSCLVTLNNYQVTIGTPNSFLSIIPNWCSPQSAKQQIFCLITISMVLLIGLDSCCWASLVVGDPLMDQNLVVRSRQ